MKNTRASLLLACFVASLLAGCGSSTAVTDAAPPATDTSGDPPPIVFPVEDLACTTSADCCVVYGTCNDRLALVTAKNRDATAAAFAALGVQQQAVRDGGSDPDCWPCIPPPVEVSCQAGRCVAERLDRTNYNLPQDLTHPHCGSLGAGDGGTSTLRSPLHLEPQSSSEPPATIGCH